MSEQQMPTSEVLNLAADYIQAFGWKQGGGWASLHGQPTCAEGAMGLVTTADFAGFHCKQAAKFAVQDYLSLATQPQHLPARFLWVWNDCYAESAEQVIEVLRAAAAIERAKEDAQLAAEFIAWQSSEVPA